MGKSLNRHKRTKIKKKSRNIFNSTRIAKSKDRRNQLNEYKATREVKNRWVLKSNTIKTTIPRIKMQKSQEFFRRNLAR